MSRVKKCFSTIVLSVFTLSCFPISSFANDEETYFIITAYYSPLPGQSGYLNGSYQAEINMNGKGTHGASGEGVFTGMLAAPKKYPFGTKIHFEGYGVAEVQDRGGAIVSAGSRGNAYDRIDIWMGYGDAGRIRATQWGRQTVKGKLVSPDSENTLEFANPDSGNYLSLRVGPDSNTENISQLQEILTQANLFSGNIDGRYETVYDELVAFQFEEEIISSYDDEAAGYFGPKTIEALLEIIPISKETLAEEPVSLFYGDKSFELSEYHEILLEYGDLRVSPESSSSDIKKLQELMSRLGWYTGEADGRYSSVENALIHLQTELGLVENKEGWGAGYFGNQTRTALWEYYDIPENREAVNTIIEQIEVIESEYILSSKEKTDIKKAISLVQKRLKTIELQGGTSMEKTLESLYLEIQSITPKIEDQEILAKLLFIQEEII
ncbi:hypothetical protein N9J72_02575 [Candidatus Gracilibacteria bacterium]|nr:hypothetical protein [Candidatus Gracilibacteria bacterium]